MSSRSRWERFLESNFAIKTVPAIITNVAGLYVVWHFFKYYESYKIASADSRAKAIHELKVYPEIESIRDDDVKRIKKYLDRTAADIKTSKNFPVIIGPQGVGKTVALEWAARNYKGVIKIDVRAGENSASILNKVCYRITGQHGSYDQDGEFMKSVIEKYEKKYDNKVPIVIINAAQRPVDMKPAELTAAARLLVERPNLNVIIDCSENAYPESLKIRSEKILNIMPMTDEMMRKLPGLEKLFEILKKQGNEEIVLAVCGGIPQLIKNLNDDIESLNTDGKLKGDELEAAQKKRVEAFLTKLLDDAKVDIKTLTKNYPSLKEILRKYQSHKSCEILISDDFIDDLRDSIKPDLEGVLRKAYNNTNLNTFVPANGAVAVWLRYGFDKKIDLEEIKKAVLSWSQNK